MAFDISKIEEKIDKVVTGSIELVDDGGGIFMKRLADAMEVAKMMSTSKQAIPSFMRGEPGLCYSAVVRSVRWRLDPYFIAENMYLVNNKGEEKVAFMAQLIIAVINAHAPLQKKLRVVYTGEGEAMFATIYGLPKGQTEELDYETPTLGALKAARGKNDYGKLKGSPLYETDPKQQLWYYGARGFCRRHFPEVLAGVYDVDEFEPVEPKDVTPERPTLSARLKNQKRIPSARGFDVAHVERETQSDPVSTAPGSVEEAAPISPPGIGAVLTSEAATEITLESSQ
jgi:hypothetical protein